MKEKSEESLLIDLLEGNDNQLLLDNIRTVYNKFQDKLTQLSLLRELGNILLYVNDFKKICQTIMDITINNSVARNCSIMLFDFDVNKLFLAAATNPSGKSYVVNTEKIFSKEDLRYTFSYGEGIAGEVLQKKEPILIDDVHNSPIFDNTKQTRVEIGTLLSVPLIIEDTACGVLTLSHPQTNMFNPNDVNLFMIVANVVALALNSALSYEMLKNSEEKYRALTEYSNDGITIIQGGKHMYSNQAYKSMTCYTFKELRNIRFDQILFPVESSNGVMSKMNPLDSNIPGTFEGTLITKDKKKIAVEISHASFMYMGQYTMIISIRDIRERKELELKLQQAHKMEALGIIAGGVAHDLNNILSGITSYPDLLLMDIPQDSPLRKPLLTIKKSGEKATATVQDLLTLARRGVVEMEVVNINQLVEEYIESPEHKKIKANHPQIRIIKKLETGGLNILGSPYHLSKTTLNLVLNAAEAMPDSGDLIISTEIRHMDRPTQGFELIEEGDYVVLTVSDTGEGILPESMSKLFEPFYTKKKFGRSGSGLGLSIVWGTVKDHGGFIDVNSIKGKGSTFSLYFPLTRQKLNQDKRSLSLDSYQGKGEKILVVDDVLEQREIASMILTKLGYQVAAVSSGEEAVEYLKDHKVDLLILDMIMDPGMDGLDTYKKIIKINPDQKAIITSGFSENERVRKAESLGVCRYIKKPYTIENLGIAIKESLSRL